MSYSSRDYFADSSSTDDDEFRLSRARSFVTKDMGLHGWTQWRCNLNDVLIKVMTTRRLVREQYRKSNILVDGNFIDSMAEPEIAMERRLSDFVLGRAVEDKREDGDRLMLQPEAFISFGIPRARLQGASSGRSQSSGRTTPSDDSIRSRPRRYVTYSDEYLIHD